MSTIRQWVIEDTATSEFQASCQQAWLAWLQFRANPVAMIGLSIVLGLVFMAILAPVLTTGNGITQNLANRLQPPSSGHWFGTDELGRDIYQRIVWGSQITLRLVGLVAVITIPVGMTIGIVSGYFGGWIDTVLMRITDVFLSFPKLILALAFVAVLGPGLNNAVIAISLLAWAPYARIVRAEALTIRSAEYITAARLQGASHLRILFHHVMPLCLSTVIVRLSFDIAGIILVAAALGFLGLGAQPPTPEWGAMVASGRQYVFDQWWASTFPGLAIFIVSMGFNLLGDGLRDVLDPKSSQ